MTHSLKRMQTRIWVATPLLQLSGARKLRLLNPLQNADFHRATVCLSACWSVWESGALSLR